MDSDVRRFFTGEWRVHDKNLAIVGYLPFESKSSVLRTPSGKEFREILTAGSLKNGTVPVFLEHDENKQIATATNISSDKSGLVFKFFPPKDAFGRKILAQVKAGQLQVSPGFHKIHDTWSYDTDGMPLRRIHAANLIELSLCKHPAYEATSSCAVEQRNLRDLEAKTVRFLDGLLVIEEDPVKVDYSVLERR